MRGATATNSTLYQLAYYLLIINILSIGFSIFLANFMSILSLTCQQIMSYLRFELYYNNPFWIICFFRSNVFYSMFPVITQMVKSQTVFFFIDQLLKLVL